MENIEKKDRTIKCYCGKEWIFTVADQDFFAKQGFTEPVRCKECRVDHRRKQNERRMNEKSIS